MAADITVPVFPESVSDGTLTTWRKKPGEAVKRGEVVVDIETDKVVFEVPAIEDGVLAEVVVAEGAIVTSGQVLGRIDSSAPSGRVTEMRPAPAAKSKEPSASTRTERVTAPAVMPAARKLMAERKIESTQVRASGKGGRVLKEDVLRAVEDAEAPTTVPAQAPATPAPRPAFVPAKAPTAPEGERPSRRVPMTRLRARIAERLVEAQRTAAILTTFNEVNMQPVIDLRDRYREQFEQEHGVRLGFMGFFVKAAVEALKRFPEVNASIDGQEVVYHGYFDIGIAVSSPRGLVVPIVRDADQLTLAQIETRIREYGDKAKSGALAIEDITGGTFTITNGGVFGSLLSTPILNPPQSAILGMHKTQPRPVAENNAVVIRPMMYLALSYDHRIVDGREAVQFLVTIKEQLEDPARLLLGV